jgi:predicted GNAT family acetyltransferase
MDDERTPELTITDHPDEGRFEAHLPDGTLAGPAEYTVRDGAAVFTHTEVPPELEGRGIAGAVVREALSQVRARGLRVVAECPYVQAYLRRHPDES